MKSLEIPAHAKINFGLRVMGLRDDHYHDISSVMIKVLLCDTIRITAQEKISSRAALKVTTDNPSIPEGEDNIAYQAADAFFSALRDAFGFDVTIRIKKRIPHGAGLGGGSSDAATVLQALNSLLPMDQNMSRAKLIEIGASVGSDVPFFLRGHACIVSGRGEQLREIDLKHSLFLVCCMPHDRLSTRDVYRLYDMVGSSTSPDIQAIASALEAGCLESACGSVANDLEKAAVRLSPAISRIKQELHATGPLCVSMSGSGSCVYAVYADVAQARHAYRQVRDKDFVRWSKLTKSLTR